MGWFRLPLRTASLPGDQPLALLCQQYGAAEIYLDGRLLHRFGRVAANAAGENTRRDLNPHLLFLNPGTDHLLAIRHSNHSARSLAVTDTRVCFKAVP